MPRYKLTIEYDGRPFAGWQRQDNAPSVQQTLEQAALTLRGEFEPISDMRASAAYRRQVLGNLLERLWLQTQGHDAINLESVHPGVTA